MLFAYHRANRFDEIHAALVRIPGRAEIVADILAVAIEEGVLVMTAPNTSSGSCLDQGQAEPVRAYAPLPIVTTVT